MDKIGLIKLTLDGTKTLASRFLFTPPPSEKILDPMSTIIRLAILSYKAEGTKLSIHDNSLYFQAPNYFQAPLRWGYSDDREDLHNLHNPIAKSLDWYDLKLEYVAKIFELAKQGLESIKDCYKGTTESNLVCHSLNYYAKMIDLQLDSVRPKTTELVVATSLSNKTSNNGQDNTSVPQIVLNDAYNNLETNIYNHSGITKLKEFWTYNELHLINEMFKIVDEYKIKGESLSPLLLSIDMIVKGKDIKVQDLIVKLTTTLTN